jgi:hypothetical protein
VHDRDHATGTRVDRPRLLAGPRPWSLDHGFVGYFSFSPLFFPVALIVAYMVDDRFATSVRRSQR